MDRLTIEEVQQIKDDWNDPYMGKPNNFWENRINSLFDTIEAQEQEIDRLKHHIDNHIKWNEAHTKARVEQGELIDKLTADKDEQAGRIMELDSGLERLRLSLQWLYEINTNRWYKEWAKEKIAEIDALLGGKEDA